MGKDGGPLTIIVETGIRRGWRGPKKSPAGAGRNAIVQVVVGFELGQMAYKCR